MMRHVDLCSGIGGFALGFEWAGLSKPVLFCDIEPWSRQILNKHWPDVPIAEDVKVLANDPDKHVPDCDILTAGYPCQPFSVAGQRRGTEDDRHIWPNIFSIIQRKRPTWTVFENVYGHVSMGLDEVLSDLEGESYATRPFIVPACAADAPHRRDRVWIIARNVGNTKHDGSPSPTVKRSIGEASKHNTQGQSKTEQSEGASQSRDSGGLGESAITTSVADTDSLNRGAVQEPQRRRKENSTKRQSPSNSSSDVANANCTGLQQGDKEMERRPSKQSNGGSVQSRKALADARGSKCKGGGERSVLRERNLPTQSGRGGKDIKVRWSTKSPMGGVVDGVSPWMDEPRDIGRVISGLPKRAARLKGLGNAIVPQIAQRIGETIKQVEEQNE